MNEQLDKLVAEALTQAPMDKILDFVATRLRSNEAVPCTSTGKAGCLQAKGRTWPITPQGLCPACALYWHIVEAMKCYREVELDSKRSSVTKAYGSRR